MPENKYIYIYIYICILKSVLFEFSSDSFTHFKPLIRPGK